ncbi:MAG: AAA family ATPase, partial [Clostridium sp.]
MPIQKFKKNEIELERDVQEQLAEWKKKRHMTVLQVEGPRQVGKTHEVRKFVYNSYRQVIYVNLVRDEFGFEDLILTNDFMEQYCQKAGIGTFID